MAELIIALLGGGLIGSLPTYRTHQREIGVKMIEVVTGVLRTDPDPSTRALRDWAVDVLAHYSKHHVPLSPEAKAELRSKPLPIVVEGVGLAAGSASVRGRATVGD